MRVTKSLAQLYGKMDIEELVKYVVCKNMRQADIKTVVVNCKCSSNNPLFAALKILLNKRDFLKSLFSSLSSFKKIYSYPL